MTSNAKRFSLIHVIITKQNLIRYISTIFILLVFPNPIKNMENNFHRTEIQIEVIYYIYTLIYIEIKLKMAEMVNTS